MSNVNNWYKLDNVAKVFLATRNKRDTRTLRVSCTLTEEINPVRLQEALDRTVKLRPQFQIRIRRGFFWHYMESTSARALVHEENERPCPLLYGPDYKGILHYQVTYYGKRINLELFHAISDGTGALDFLHILVLNYLKLMHHEELKGITLGSQSSADDRERDSFSHYCDEKCVPAKKLFRDKAYHPQSAKLPYNQLRFFELHLDMAAVKAKAKEYKVGPTSYMGALLMAAFYQDMPARMRKKPITISMPVNLRNYFPSATTRNFFNNVDVKYTFTGEEELSDLILEFDRRMKDALEPEKIKQQMNNYAGLEQIIVARVAPLFIKQPVVRYFTKLEEKSVTAVLSNLGVMRVPEMMEPYIEGYSAYCSTGSMFMTMMSYDKDMVLGVSSAYSNTSVLRTFVQFLRGDDIEVKLYASEVLE